MPTRAVIDIGTNSVKLLVAEVSNNSVAPLYEGSEQTRLGAGFYETHILSAEAIENTARAVQAFVENASRFSPVSLEVIATSAARDAINQSELLEAVHREAGQKLMVITGDREAEWAFAGVASDPRFRDAPLVVMDIGGGSTEFIVGKSGVRHVAKSFQLGSVRLLEKFRPSDPPTEAERMDCLTWLREFFSSEIKTFLEQHLRGSNAALVSTGGTASILGRIKLKLNHYDREKLENTALSAGELASETKRIWSLPLEQRKRLPGLPSSRADVIIMGAAILEAAVESLGFQEARISLRGLRYGALLHSEKAL